MSEYSAKKTAELLEKSAAYIEALEAENAMLRARENEQVAEKTAETKAALASAYRERTGNELSDEVLDKIAQDETIVKAFERVSALDGPPALGSAHRISEKTAADGDESPEAAFGSWILS